MTKPDFADPAALRVDLVAGLTAAAVVLPKAIDYATVADLPVSVVSIRVRADGRLCAAWHVRVLSVSSTTTLAILTAAELGAVVPDGDPTKLITATATLTLLSGACLIAASLLQLGFVALLQNRRTDRSTPIANCWQRAPPMRSAVCSAPCRPPAARRRRQSCVRSEAARRRLRS
jgi:Sulfate permease family